MHLYERLVGWHSANLWQLWLPVAQLESAIWETQRWFLQRFLLLEQIPRSFHVQQWATFAKLCTVTLWSHNFDNFAPPGLLTVSLFFMSREWASANDSAYNLGKTSAYPKEDKSSIPWCFALKFRKSYSSVTQKVFKRRFFNRGIYRNKNTWRLDF